MKTAYFLFINAARVMSENMRFFHFGLIKLALSLLDESSSSDPIRAPFSSLSSSVASCCRDHG
jgi:hypothetical protein